MLQTSDNENISLEFKGHVRDKTSLNESKLRDKTSWKITLSLIKNTACIELHPRLRASVQSKLAMAFFLGLDCCWPAAAAVAGEVAAVPMERQREAERARPVEMRAMDGKAMMKSKSSGRRRNALWIKLFATAPHTNPVFARQRLRKALQGFMSKSSSSAKMLRTLKKCFNLVTIIRNWQLS